MSDGTPRDETVTLNGLRFHYRDWGNPEAPPLLLLHFFTWNASTWDTLAAALRADFRVLALDQRGHGETEWADDYAHERGGEDIAAFARALHLSRLRIVGFSMGGHAALRYAAEHPESIERLVIGETIPEQRPQARGYITAWRNRPHLFDDPERAAPSLRPLIPRAPEAELSHWVLHNLRQRDDGRWTWRHDPRFGPPDYLRPSADPARHLAALPRIACPTLVVRGAESEMYEPDQAEAVAAAIPNGRAAHVPDAGHWVPLDNSSGCLAELRGFLSET